MEWKKKSESGWCECFVDREYGKEREYVEMIGARGNTSCDYSRLFGKAHTEDIV